MKTALPPAPPLKSWSSALSPRFPPASWAPWSLLGESLVRIFNFNNATKSWTFYDPRAEFAEANTIDELFSGEIYWVNVTEDTSAVLNDRTRNLSCVEGDCWNQIVW